MIERAHGVEGVCRVVGAGQDAFYSFIVCCVRMTDAGMHARRLCFGDGLSRPRKLRGDSHHANRARRCFPIFPEELSVGWNEILWWMYASLGMADERSLQMDAEQTRTTVPFILCGRLAQIFQSTQDAILGSRDGYGEIAGHPVPGHSCFYRRQGGIVCFHHIVT